MSVIIKSGESWLSEISVRKKENKKYGIDRTTHLGHVRLGTQVPLKRERKKKRAKEETCAYMRLLNYIARVSRSNLTLKWQLTWQRQGLIVIYSSP